MTTAPVASPPGSELERNLGALTAYTVAFEALFWLPLFFLYFSSKVGVAEVLTLEATYYASVVVLEVPSGYFSDRVGRRITLVIAAAAASMAYVGFVVADTMAGLVAAQVLLATAMAFRSGTDSALLYDTLQAMGRAETFVSHMARLRGRAFASMAAACLVGGFVASLGLRLPYILSALCAAVAVGCALALREPARELVCELVCEPDREPQRSGQPPVRPLLPVLRQLRQPRLAWLFAFSVGSTVFNHVPYELIQPYMRLVMAGWGYASQLTPAALGVLGAVTLVVASVAASRAVWLQRRCGLAWALLGTMALQGVIIASMAWLVHPAVLGIAALRSVPAAVGGTLVDAATHPYLASDHRATYLSLQSLAGRLAFATTLAISALCVGEPHQMGFAVLSQLATAYALGACVFIAAMFLRRP